MSDPDDEKNAQHIALDKAMEILGEHFDNIVIVADCTNEKDEPYLYTRRKGPTWILRGLMLAFSDMCQRAFIVDDED